jgi:hypothetical protein
MTEGGDPCRGTLQWASNVRSLGSSRSFFPLSFPLTFFHTCSRRLAILHRPPPQLHHRDPLHPLPRNRPSRHPSLFALSSTFTSNLPAPVAPQVLARSRTRKRNRAKQTRTRLSPFAPFLLLSQLSSRTANNTNKTSFPRLPLLFHSLFPHPRWGEKQANHNSHPRLRQERHLRPDTAHAGRSGGCVDRPRKDGRREELGRGV